MASTSPPSGRNHPPRETRHPHDPGQSDACHDGCGPARRGAPRFSPSWARPLRRGPRLAHDIAAVTPVVGTLVILGISSVGIAAVMTWGLPNVQQTQAVTELDGVLNQFYAIDHIVDGVMRGGAIDKASEGTLSIPKGQVERTNGTLFAISWSPNHTARDDRFWLTGVGDETPLTFEIHAGDIAAADGDYVVVERVRGATVTSLTGDGGSYGNGNSVFADNAVGADTNPVTITLGTGLETQSTRIRVIEEGGTPLDGPVLMEAWILPSGSLHYIRDTSFGLAGFRLENSAVISNMETGSLLRTQPLGTIERDGADEPLFLGLFQVLFVDDPNRPGVEAAGAGSFPILFSLQANNLRADGLKTEAVHLDAIGARAGLWEDNYANAMDLPRLRELTSDHPYATDADPLTNPAGLYLEAKTHTVGGDTREAFDFVLLESIIAVSLQVENGDLGTGV